MAKRPRIRVGELSVDGFNMSAVIRKVGDSSPAGEWETVCVVKSEDWRDMARLFAAAPDLLAALRGVVAVADRRTTEFDMAHAAIFKATGQHE